MGLIRRPLFHVTLLAALFFLVGFMYKYHLPKFESLLLVKLEKLSQQHSPVRIWAKKLNIHLLPIGVVLEDVQAMPQKPIDRYMAPAHFGEVGARLAILPLLRGEVRLAEVFVRDSDLSFFLRPELFQGSSKDQTHINFDAIYRLPIDAIALERVRIMGRLQPQNVVFKVDELNLRIENRYRSLYVDLAAPSVQVKPSGWTRQLEVQLELRTLVEAKEMQVSAFKLKADQSFAVASGRFNGDLANGKLENGALDARAKFNLTDINVWEGIFRVKPELPKLSGRAELDVGIETKLNHGYKLSAEITTENLQIERFKLGHLEGQLTTNLKELLSESFALTNNAGKIKLSKLKLQLEPPYALNTQIQVDDVEVRQFLENINVHKVPIFLPVSGQATCQGSWGSAPEANCHASVRTPRLWVHNGPPKRDTIVEVHDLRGEGDAKVTLQDVQFKAQVKAGKSSTGKTSGVVNYEKGFKISYDGENIALADVKSLANLKLEGGLKLSGTTEGTASWATIDMNAEAHDFWLENYPFGHFATKLKYKKGHIYFNSVQGQYGSSQYAGALDLDLTVPQMKLELSVPFADLHDLQQIFQRQITLPFDVAGTGQGSIEAQGPLSLQELTYKVRSNFFRGEAANESFDEFTFNVSAKNGLVKSDRITLTKSSGITEAKGQITPKGEIDSVVVGRSLRLEQSENILNFGLDLQGLADFTILIRGQLPRPRVELNGRLSKVVLADQPAEDSVFKLNFLRDRLEGSGQFLGTTLLSDFTFPYDNEAPFALHLKAHKWDFTSLFSVVSRSARQLDFSTQVSGSVDLNAPRGGVWASTGQIQVDEFSLRKGAKSLSASKPMFLYMRNGEVNSNAFNIGSGDSYLKLDVVNLTRDRLNASLNGKLDVSLLGLFTPFISDLRGNMALSMDLRGSAAQPALSGSAYIDKGYVKLIDFPHPFSNARADILFNDNQVVINSVRADLSGGKVNGDGRITFSGNTRPIEINGAFNDVKMNVPTGFRTQGSGTVKINGNGFPYNMNINYSVSGGEIVYEFGEDASSFSTIKASTYLPRFLYQEAFHPFNFNIDVDLKNTIPVSNSLTQVQVGGQLNIAGTPDRLLLTGTLTPTPGGKVFFRDTAFEISSGYVEYNAAPPANPKIYLTANARVTEVVQDEQSRTKETLYDINLLAQGRGPVPQITLASQPPLSEREIVSLLALGVTTTTSSTLDDRKTSEFQAANTSTALGAAILQKAGGRRLKESLGLDVKVSSSQPTPDTASTPKVTISKQWTPKFGASASSTIQANPTNSVKLEYKMNKNVSVIGSWDGREYVKEQTNPVLNVLGLDLEYKMQFK